MHLDVREYDVTSIRLLAASQRTTLNGVVDDTQTSLFSFHAFGTTHHLTLKKLRSPSLFGKYGIPVSIITDEGTLTKTFSYTKVCILHYVDLAHKSFL